jgi:16S rRNA (cytidine1402-2'-O)-methyltransferase
MPTKIPSANRQNLPETDRPRISMIATPIGNLGDIGGRALESLREVDEIWCEDTRHTRALLTAFGLGHKKLLRVDQHTSDQTLLDLLGRVASENLWVGVVTDAGTPGLSDPGSRIAQLLPAESGVRLEPVPGPSALSALVSVGGFAGNSFCFQGFFPRAESDARDQLDCLYEAALSPNWIFFESTHRIRAAVQVLEGWCRDRGVSPGFVFGKELTKAHERILRGRGDAFLKSLQDPSLDVRGEWVFALVLSSHDLKKNQPGEAWESALECLVFAGISPKSAAQLVSGRFSVAKNLAYKRALDFQKKSFPT